MPAASQRNIDEIINQKVEAEVNRILDARLTTERSSAFPSQSVP